MVLVELSWVTTASLMITTIANLPVLAPDHARAPTIVPVQLPIDYGKAPTVLPAELPMVETTNSGTPHLATPNTGCCPSPQGEHATGPTGSGSHPGRYGHGGHAGRYEVPPLGAFLYAHGRTQVANGEAARMILYDYDFVAGTNLLNVRGKERLAKIATYLPANFFPVVIEQTAAGAEVDEARRQSVLEELLRGPFPIPPERVVVGDPLSTGLRGVEAELIYHNMLMQTQTRGALGNLGSNISFPSSSATGTGVPAFGTGLPVPR